MRRKKSQNEISTSSRQDVHIQRNAIENFLLNIKHYVQHNSAKVFRLSLLFLLILVILAVLYGVNKWANAEAYQELYLGRKALKEARESLSLLDLMPKTDIKKKGKSETDSLLAQSRDEFNSKIKTAQEKLKEVASSIVFSFSDASDLALYYLGMAYYENKEYEGAVKSFSHFVDANEGHFLSLNALKMQALSLENQKKYADAYTVYEIIHKRKGSNYLSAQSLYDMGRMQELLGKKEKAIKHYVDVIRKYKNKSLFFANLARQRLFLINQAS